MTTDVDEDDKNDDDGMTVRRNLRMSEFDFS